MSWDATFSGTFDAMPLSPPDDAIHAAEQEGDESVRALRIVWQAARTLIWSELYGPHDATFAVTIKGQLASSGTPGSVTVSIAQHTPQGQRRVTRSTG